mmetsp:Transcript_39474/g.113491  ORF Transcript_39474/g.113491 Transcript_39474/m.113491 type:complete len:258 (-) Transcript_39474:87-860(-)
MALFLPVSICPINCATGCSYRAGKSMHAFNLSSNACHMACQACSRPLVQLPGKRQRKDASKHNLNSLRWTFPAAPLWMRSARRFASNSRCASLRHAAAATMAPKLSATISIHEEFAPTMRALNRTASRKLVGTSSPPPECPNHSPIVSSPSSQSPFLADASLLPRRQPRNPRLFPPEGFSLESVSAGRAGERIPRPTAGAAGTWGEVNAPARRSSSQVSSTTLFQRGSLMTSPSCMAPWPKPGGILFKGSGGGDMPP